MFLLVMTFQTYQQNDYIMTIPAEKLNAAIKNVIYACGKDDKRPYLSGILFELRR